MDTIYLAGGIAGLTSAQCNDWRNKVMQELDGKYLFRNPMNRDYRAFDHLSQNTIEEIVELDKLDIDNSDIVLAMAQVPSWGTAMEIIYAAERYKNVICVVNPGRISPWVAYHADSLFYTLDEAVEVLSEFK
jgi:nucleoside 2-deoxyribosyltransferase